MCGPSEVVDQALKVHDAFAICAPSISQRAALIALKNTAGSSSPGKLFVAELSSALARRRELLCRRLDSLGELFSYQSPKGAYYVFAKYFEKLSSFDFAVKLLNEAKVITIPGSGFGPSGEGHIRFSFGSTERDIGEAFDRIEKWHSSRSSSSHL